MMPSAIFVLTAALQTKFSLSSKFLKNLRSMPNLSTPVLSTSRKHTTGFFVKSFGKCCGKAVLTVACYWPSSRIPAQNYVSVSAELIYNRSFTVGVDTTRVCVVTLPLHIQYEFDKQSLPSQRWCHCWKLQD